MFFLANEQPAAIHSEVDINVTSLTEGIFQKEIGTIASRPSFLLMLFTVHHSCTCIHACIYKEIRKFVSNDRLLS